VDADGSAAAPPPTLPTRLPHPWRSYGPALWELYTEKGRFSISWQAGLWWWRAPPAWAGGLAQRGTVGRVSASEALADLEAAGVL
jgi:hypothetical protein